MTGTTIRTLIGLGIFLDVICGGSWGSVSAGPSVEFNRPEGAVRMAAIAELSSSVSRSEPSDMVTPNDPDFYKQEYLQRINAPAAWARSTGAGNIIVAVIDSGVDITHPDLKENLWVNYREIPGNKIDDDANGYVDDVNGWDFVANTPDPSPKFTEPYSKLGINHGTIVAGVLAARGNNNMGITGIAWKTKIMALRVLDGVGEGRTDKVAAAIDYARANGARIINLSFVGHDSSVTMTQAISDAWKAGILIVAAAGNEVREGVNLDITPAYPVCQAGTNGEKWVMGVTSVDLADRRASFSNYGRRCVDVAAPGMSVYSTVVFRPSIAGFEEPYSGWWTGTSVAVPQVSGLAALIWSLKPTLTLAQLQDIIKEQAQDIDNMNPEIGGLLGRGRVDMHASLEKAIGTTPGSQEEYPRTSSGPAPSFIIAAQRSAGAPEVKIYNNKASLLKSFYAYNSASRVAVNVAAADLDGDRELDVVTGVGKGGAPQVNVFSLQGILKSSFYAYNPNYLNGFNVAAGDVDGDGYKEIITAPMPGGGPHVRIFSFDGKLKGQFFAFEENARYGIHVATGDVDGDGSDEIIIGAGAGRTAAVRVFTGQGVLRRELIVFPISFTGGVTVATTDLDGDNKKEIIVGAGSSGGPQVRVINQDGGVLMQFFAFAQNFKGGVQVASGDVNHDQRDEIIVGAGTGGGPQVRVFNASGTLMTQFFSFAPTSRNGVNVASGQ
ncbi:MAG: S8 family serine peptidase [Patescibacteria group bacterium]